MSDASIGLAAIRSNVLALGGFLLTWELALRILVDQPKQCLSGGADLDNPEMSETDRILVLAVSSFEPEAFFAAMDWWVEQDVLTPEQRDELGRLYERRAVLLDHPGDAVVQGLGPELLAASMVLRDRMSTANTWWLVEIDAALQPDVFDPDAPTTSMFDAFLDLVQRALYVE